ncbi:hypothetical protein BGX20_003625 [Mortierella sp. AD010]|nr:hypothetical protein BGX20_003625 [Mortierella sp. AD010]
MLQQVQRQNTTYGARSPTHAKVPRPSSHFIIWHADIEKNVKNAPIKRPPLSSFPSFSLPSTTSTTNPDITLKMRSSLFLAVASALIASVWAHDGPHDTPTTAPSVCLSAPTNATCSSFVIPSATITSAIGDICKASSFLPGCSLNTACSADSSLNATYCAPLTILATLCTAVDDTALTNSTCGTTYNVFCSKDSLIPGCKSQPAFPGLPSGKAVTGAIYSVCQEMPMMTDCKICPAPDAKTGYSNCDEVKAWKGLCLDMPDMTQCPPFNTMCNSTKFAPFCSMDYKSPNNGAVTSPSNTTNTTSPSTSTGGNGKSGAGALAGSVVMTSLVAIVAGVSALIL